jgi:hypothetical protein
MSSRVKRTKPIPETNETAATTAPEHAPASLQLSAVIGYTGPNGFGKDQREGFDAYSATSSLNSVRPAVLIRVAYW